MAHAALLVDILDVMRESSITACNRPAGAAAPVASASDDPARDELTDQQARAGGGRRHNQRLEHGHADVAPTNQPPTPPEQQ
jgi:hypothetical protein